MENNTSIWGILILVFLFFIVFTRGGLFGGAEAANHGCGCVSNCEVQKQEIIDNARNLYAIEQSGNTVIANANANTQRLYDQSARQYEAGLQEKIFDLKMGAQTTAIIDSQEINALKAENANLKRDSYFSRRLDAIECQMLPKPPIYGQAVVTTATAVPATVGCSGGLL